MTMHTCPRCGQPTEIPQLFSKQRQAVFTYIWNNPWVSMREIEEALFSGKVVPNAVSVHISRIADYLRDTEYRLNYKYSPYYHGSARLYRIIYAKKGEENAPANVATVLR